MPPRELGVRLTTTSVGRGKLSLSHSPKSLAASGQPPSWSKSIARLTLGNGKSRSTPGRSSADSRNRSFTARVILLPGYCDRKHLSTGVIWIRSPRRIRLMTSMSTSCSSEPSPLEPLLKFVEQPENGLGFCEGLIPRLQG